MASEPQPLNLPLPNYFSEFTSSYIAQTAQTTLDIFGDVITDYIQTSDNPIGPESVVHDTAAGPAIAAAAIVGRLAKDQLPKKVSVSDNNENMVAAARKVLAKLPLPEYACELLDSENLSAVPSEYFTHSINNFSIFNFKDPIKAVSEAYRTLAPGGLAVFTCWERFPPGEIAHAAQKQIRPDLPLLPGPDPMFYRKKFLSSIVLGGFTDVDAWKKDFIVRDEAKIAALTGLMTGDMMKKAYENYTPEEKDRWPGCVSRLVEEAKMNGGIKFQAFIVLAYKPWSDEAK